MSAGSLFLAVVEQNPEDRRALGNWGNALCLRAELAQDPEVRGPHAAMLTLWHSECCITRFTVSALSWGRSCS